MTVEAWIRLLLLFSHLIFSAYALHLVIKTDLRVLQRSVSTRTLMRVHHRMSWLLAGLWLTGVSLVGVDFWPDLARIFESPKLLAKLCCVLALTANAFVLRTYALPRLAARRELGAFELTALSATGAVSSASWLMAAFIGVARPMATWTTAEAIGLYVAVLGAAVVVALWVCPPRLQRRSMRSGQTAVEEAAETLHQSAAPSARA